MGTRYEDDALLGKGPDPIETIDTPKKKNLNWLKIVALVVVTSLVTLTAAWQLDGFETYQPPTDSERYEEFLNFIDQRFNDENTDATLFEAGLYDINLQELAGNNTRLVGVNITILLSVDEVREQLQLTEEDELPQFVVEALTPEGFFPTQFRNDFVLGFLTKDFVVMPLSILEINNNKVSAELAEKIVIDVVLKPDLATEDNWKTEILFSGTLAEFVENENIHVDGSYGLAFLPRPQDKLIAEPDGFPDEYLNFEDIALASVAVYTKALYGEIKVVEGGSVIGQNSGYILVKGNFTNDIPGAAVYVLQDGNPVWVGIFVKVIGDIAFVLNAQAIVDSAQGFGLS